LVIAKSQAQLLWILDTLLRQRNDAVCLGGPGVGECVQELHAATSPEGGRSGFYLGGSHLALTSWLHEQDGTAGLLVFDCSHVEPLIPRYSCVLQPARSRLTCNRVVPFMLATPFGACSNPLEARMLLEELRRYSRSQPPIVDETLTYQTAGYLETVLSHFPPLTT
jgi:hypothetical protein